jgi:para-aminobenzoate synthetase component 1
MIVDLERNDLGRVAIPGSVCVPELLQVVSHSTVHHLESRVVAKPKRTVDLTDILRATFPGGSITGAPKIRAMEIIAEMEQAPRGPYCGALGYVAYGGRKSHWSIPIRTAVIHDNELSFRVGGGIVADSDPQAEYEETLLKAKAFLDILI